MLGTALRLALAATENTCCVLARKSWVISAGVSARFQIEISSKSPLKYRSLHARKGIAYGAPIKVLHPDGSTNGTCIAQASNQITYTWAVTNIAQNYSNNVTFAVSSQNEKIHAPHDVMTNVLGWVAGFGMSEDISFTSNSLSLYQEYLLNINPYVSNAVNFAVDAIAVTGSTVNVTVKLLECTNGGVFCAQPNIFGSLVVQGTTNLAGVWTPIMSANPGTVVDSNGRAIFSFPANTNQFYRAQIQ